MINFAQTLKFRMMYNLTLTTSEIKLQLFRFIDTLPENRLQKFYNLLILNKKQQQTDFLDLLSDWEKEDINAGISDLENGAYKPIDEVLAKY
jgi:hypothetical protein